MNELSERQKIILSLLVHEHSRTALPVASATLIRQYGLKVSSATVRNELNILTELGYLRQPHTSAGRVPTEEGYRFFVSNLISQTSLPSHTRNTIAHQFYQLGNGLDQGLPLAASILAKQSSAVSIVTAPHAPSVSFKHLELLATRANQVLLVLVLQGGELNQQMLNFSLPQSQLFLSELANRLNVRLEGLNLEQIKALPSVEDEAERQVLNAVCQQLGLAQKWMTGELYLDGLNNLLSEPEFSAPGLARPALRLLEERPLLDDFLSRTILTEKIGDVQVLIGGEGTWQELRDCAVILTRYGNSENLSGTLGVLGPMRLPYSHTISALRFVADLLSEILNNSPVVAQAEAQEGKEAYEL